jgi:dTDP-glucose 4,6-dehydratase
MISNCLQRKPLPIYGNGKNVRDWLHVKDHCSAIDTVVRYGADGSTYNVGGINEWTNIDLVHLLCDTISELRPLDSGKSYRELITFVKNRPGHDLRYAICANAIEKDLHWKPEYTFEEGLKETVRWYLDNNEWSDKIRKEKYDGERLGV